MDTDNMIFKAVYVDPDVDRTVLARAERLGVPAGSVYRLFLETGLAELAKGVPLPPVQQWEAIALRTTYVLVQSDEKARVMAYRLRMPKSDVYRCVARLGMERIEAKNASK